MSYEEAKRQYETFSNYKMLSDIGDIFRAIFDKIECRADTAQRPNQNHWERAVALQHCFNDIHAELGITRGDK